MESMNFRDHWQKGGYYKDPIPALAAEQVWIKLRHGCGFLWQRKMYWSQN